MVKRLKQLSLWLKSPAGIISVLLLLLGVVLLVVDIIAETQSLFSNVRIGFATNLFGIVITISFVQHYFDRQKVQKEMREEKSMILRYNRIVCILLRKYKLLYYCMTHPISKRKSSDRVDLQPNFKFEDLCDLHMNAVITTNDMFESNVSLFYDAEIQLRNFFITMVENVKFEHFPAIRNAIESYITLSLENDVRGAIVGEQKKGVRYGDKNKVDTIRNDILNESKYHWCAMYEQGKLGANAMLPYVMLYKLMQQESLALIAYEKLLISLLGVK